MTTKTQTPDELRARADALALEAAQAQAELDRHDAEEYARQQEAQAARDRALVDGYDREPHDRAVQDARDAYHAAVRDWPVTQAMAALILAENRRRWAYFDLIAARGRLGMSDNYPQPESLFIEPVADTVATMAQQIAQAQTDAERAALEG